MMPITLDQLTEILNRADTVVSMGHGRNRVKYNGEYPETTELQGDTVAFAIRDDDSDDESAFTYKALLDGELSIDGQMLIAKDDDDHAHWLKFREYKDVDLKALLAEVAAVEARERDMGGAE